MSLLSRVSSVAASICTSPPVVVAMAKLLGVLAISAAGVARLNGYDSLSAALEAASVILVPGYAAGAISSVTGNNHD